MAKITQYNRIYHDFLVVMKAHMNAQADILERRAQRLDADDRPASADEARQQAHYCRLYAQRTQDDIDDLLSWKDEEGEQSMAPTAQAQRAINQMLQAGFKRTEFSVRTARHYVGKVNGKRCYEYGNASITVKMKSRDMVKYIRPAIKAGLGVIAYRARKGLYLITFTTKFCGLHVYDPGYRDPVTLSNRRVHKRPRPDRDARPPTYLVTYTQRITGSYEHKILIGAWNEAEAIENFYRGQVKRYGEDHQTTALSAERFEVK